MDCSPPGSFIHGIFQARILECVSISYSGYLPNSGIEQASSASADGFFTTEQTGEPGIADLKNLAFNHSIAFK